MTSERTWLLVGTESPPLGRSKLTVKENQTRIDALRPVSRLTSLAVDTSVGRGGWLRLMLSITSGAWNARCWNTWATSGQIWIEWRFVNVTKYRFSFHSTWFRSLIVVRSQNISWGYFHMQLFLLLRQGLMSRDTFIGEQCQRFTRIRRTSLSLLSRCPGGGRGWDVSIGPFQDDIHRAVLLSAIIAQVESAANGIVVGQRNQWDIGASNITILILIEIVEDEDGQLRLFQITIDFSIHLHRILHAIIEVRIVRRRNDVRIVIGKIEEFVYTVQIRLMIWKSAISQRSPWEEGSVSSPDVAALTLAQLRMATDNSFMFGSSSRRGSTSFDAFADRAVVVAR